MWLAEISAPFIGGSFPAGVLVTGMVSTRTEVAIRSASR